MALVTLLLLLELRVGTQPLTPSAGKRPAPSTEFL